MSSDSVGQQCALALVLRKTFMKKLAEIQLLSYILIADCKNNSIQGNPQEGTQNA